MDETYSEMLPSSAVQSRQIQGISIGKTFFPFTQLCKIPAG